MDEAASRSLSVSPSILLCSTWRLRFSDPLFRANQGSTNDSKTRSCTSARAHPQLDMTLFAGMCSFVEEAAICFVVSASPSSWRESGKLQNGWVRPEWGAASARMTHRSVLRVSNKKKTSHSEEAGNWRRYWGGFRRPGEVWIPPHVEEIPQIWTGLRLEVCSTNCSGTTWMLERRADIHQFDEEQDSPNSHTGALKCLTRRLCRTGSNVLSSPGRRVIQNSDL